MGKKNKKKLKHTRIQSSSPFFEWSEIKSNLVDSMNKNSWTIFDLMFYNGFIFFEKH